LSVKTLLLGSSAVYAYNVTCLFYFTGDQNWVILLVIKEIMYYLKLWSRVKCGCLFLVPNLVVIARSNYPKRWPIFGTCASCIRTCSWTVAAITGSNKNVQKQNWITKTNIEMSVILTDSLLLCIDTLGNC